MEVFISGVPKRETERSLYEYFKGILSPLGIEYWICQKIGRTYFAKLQFLNYEDGQTLLSLHGQTGNSLAPGATSLVFKGKQLKCRLSNRQDKFALQSLARSRDMDNISAVEDTLAPARAKADASSAINNDRTLYCVSISCGIWDYNKSQVVFKSYLTLNESATMDFNNKFMVYKTKKGNRLDISYFAIEAAAWETQPSPALTFTLREAPRFFNSSQQEISTQRNEISDFLESLFGDNDPPEQKRQRLPELNQEHGEIAGTCLVYRFSLLQNKRIEHQIRKLGHVRGMPPMVRRHINVYEPTESFSAEYDQLLQRLSPTTTYLDFAIKFQVQRLAQNGYLPPYKVTALLPEIEKMAARVSKGVCINALCKMFVQIPFPGPDVEADHFNLKSLIKLLRSNQELSKRDVTRMKQSVGSENVVFIHKATVTPAGIYLFGPEMEINNRVLRKYSSNHDQFLRVQFADEDGLPIFFNAAASNAAIYERFRTILDEGIHIAGQDFSFLGFSHSSLRAQSCWFMAPFQHNGASLTDRQLIRGLGNFSQIRIPARCAARIGQAFSDTRDAIAFDPNIVGNIPDVKGDNGRIFSDGVGTISQLALEQIWDGLLAGRRKKPTVLQIRYRGAKGMIALDSRLHGKSMFLRESMIKFSESDSNDLEICSAGYKPLPLYLNQQMIKILEDMGVNHNFFLNLQSDELDSLRSATSNSIKASKFLKAHSVGYKIDLARFVTRLSNLNLSFKEDKFLTDVIETSVLIDLRALKYRARIPVKDGFTLLGIMDETGILKEDEIFCIVEIGGKMRVITGHDSRKVIITRSPALHPGDIQLAYAVTVPEESPLMQLRNCICFSQHGSRDLPSMLSGGDLDGDHYHIIFDPNAEPGKTFPPAEYAIPKPRDLDRDVNRQDMTDFFVDFMETDQLGRISNIHKIFADMYDDGVCNPDCIQLAELASRAVDFSKTGIPVEPSEISKFKTGPCRPQFMAPSPYVDVVQNKPISFATNEEEDDNEDIAKKYYYSSKKILGKLFDAIDESKIVHTLQLNRDEQRSDTYNTTDSVSSVLVDVWIHIQNQSPSVRWRDYLDQARGIRDEYDEALFNIMMEFGPRPQCPVSENEVFVGNILGKIGAQTRRQRDLSISMKERFEADLSFTANCIMGKKGYLYDEDSEEEEGGDVSGAGREDQTLALSMACLSVALNEEAGVWEYGKRGKLQLQSFGYVAAAICLRETDKLPSW